MSIEYIIILVAVIHYIHYIVRLRRKTGRIINFWIFSTYATVIHIVMYLFAKNDLNYYALGELWEGTKRNVDKAFYLLILGWIFLWIGKAIENHTRKYVDNRLVGLMVKFINSPKSRTLTLLMISPFVLITFYTSLHSTFAVGQVMTSSDTTRPLLHIATSTYSLLMITWGIYWFQYRIKRDFVIFVTLCVCSILFQTRSMLFGNMMFIVFFYLVSQGRHISLAKVGVIGVCIIVGVMVMGLLRGRSEKVSQLTVLNETLYGNTFSDLRDFAVVLSAWNGDYTYGKTYLAGAISFVPSSISDFRHNWGIGRYTTRLTGLDQDEERPHGGLRSTFVGEMFFNFGIPGVIILSTLFGFLLARFNRTINYYISQKNYIAAYGVIWSFTLVNFIAVSGTLMSFYPQFLILWGCAKLFPYKRLK